MVSNDAASSSVVRRPCVWHMATHTCVIPTIGIFLNMADNWLADIILGIGVNVAVLLLCWLRGTPSSTGLQLSSNTRRAAENRNGLSVYATFPSHFSSGLCGEDVQLAGGVVIAVAITVSMATEITATASSMSRGALT